MMNRSDLIEELARRENLTVAEARTYLDTLLSCIADSLAAGDKVTLNGFGVFSLRRRAARQMRNPSTHEVMTIVQADIPTFRASPRLRELVNESSLSV